VYRVYRVFFGLRSWFRVRWRRDGLLRDQASSFVGTSARLPTPRGTWCATYDDSVKLFWKQNQFTRSVLLQPSSNIALLRSAPSSKLFNAYCQEISIVTGEPIDEMELLAIPAAVEVSEDEESQSSDDEMDSVDESHDEGFPPDLPPTIIGDKQATLDFQQKVSDVFKSTGKINDKERVKLVENDYAQFKSCSTLFHRYNT
jgi:hypothetical protein